MIPYKSIFEIDDLTVDELMSIDQRKVFDFRKRAFYASNLKALTDDEKWRLVCQWERAPITEDEYNQTTNQIERYEDLFYLYLHRGEFDLAHEYERLAGLNYIDLWKIPRDVVQQNEPEYYEWRTSELLRRAIDIAKEAHKGQVDKAGNEYIDHPLRVMVAVHSVSEKIVGVLHDVIEDTDWTFERLEAEGFTTEIIEALKCVTKLSKDEPYNAFIERVKTNPLAVAVKIKDLADNMDIRRLNELTEKDFKRLQKYHRAYKELEQQRRKGCRVQE